MSAPTRLGARMSARWNGPSERSVIAGASS